VIDGEDEYLVEKILDSRMFRGWLKFKIKWEGYGPEHDSWEYATEVYAPELLPEKPCHAKANPSHYFFENSVQAHFSSLLRGEAAVKGGVDVRGHSGLPYTASALLTSLPVDSRPAAHFHGLLN
jgi:hypothetical protein